MPFALDTSVALSWCFADEASPGTERVLDILADDTAIVPVIWPLEIANALCVAERHGRLHPADSARFVDLIGSLPIEVEFPTLGQVFGGVMDTARAYSLSSYDASYLELAMRHGLPLATQDTRLSRAATHAGVLLLI